MIPTIISHLETLCEPLPHGPWKSSTKHNSFGSNTLLVFVYTDFCLFQTFLACPMSLAIKRIGNLASLLKLKSILITRGLRVKTADLEDFGDETVVLAQNMWEPDLWIHVLLLD